MQPSEMHGTGRVKNIETESKLMYYYEKSVFMTHEFHKKVWVVAFDGFLYRWLWNSNNAKQVCSKIHVYTTSLYIQVKH